MKSEIVTILAHGNYIESIGNLLFGFISIVILSYVSYFLIKNRDSLGEKIQNDGAIQGCIFISCMFSVVVIILYCLRIPSEMICIYNSEYCGIKTLVGK